MTKPTGNQTGAVAGRRPRAEAAWTVGTVADRPRPLDLADLPALDDLVGTTSRGGPVTWVRLERVEDLVDVAAGLGDGRPHPGLAGSARRPVAHVRRLSPDWLLLVTPTAWYTEGDRQVSTARFACLLGPGTVLTAEEGAAGVHEAMLDRLRLLGPPHDGAERRVMSAAVLSIVAGAAEVELGLGDAVAETERIVFDDRHEDPVQRIYDLKREITEARRALLPVTTELPEALDPDDAPDHPAVNRRMLERVVTTIERIDRHLDAHDDLLSDMLSAHLSRVSVRQNEDMRKISAWAAILVYPTIVAGVYGMNFRHMPELGWLLGYPFAIALMTAGCVVLYRVFKRAGWL